MDKGVTSPSKAQLALVIESAGGSMASTKPLTKVVDVEGAKAGKKAAKAKAVHVVKAHPKKPNAGGPITITPGELLSCVVRQVPPTAEK